MHEPIRIITTRAIRDRYAATLDQLARERHEAAYEWTRLHWWQFRKRRELERKLFSGGGWRVWDPALDDLGLPRRLIRDRWGRVRVYEP